MAKKTGLGMGLDALFADNAGEFKDAQTMRISQIEPNKNNPRKNIDEHTIAALAESIKTHGLIQPVLVRPYGDNYQIVAGERRYRACRMNGMTEIPVIIKEFSDLETAQIALIENLHREDLNPIDEALAYKELMEVHGMTQEQVAHTAGKSRSAVANSVRLLNLPDSVQTMLKKGELSSGHAKVIAGLKDDKKMLELANMAKDGGVTVRRLETLVSEAEAETGENNPSQKSSKESPQKSASIKVPHTYFTEMEISLENTLSRKIKINSKDGEQGTITIDFFDKDDLSMLADKLTLY